MTSAEKAKNLSNNNNNNNNNTSNSNSNNNSSSNNSHSNGCSKHHHSNGKSNWNAAKMSSQNKRNLQITRCNRHQKSSSTTTTTTTTNQTNHHHHNNGGNHGHHRDHRGHQNGGGIGRKSDSILSTDSDIRFTRKKLGDSQRCGCIVIAGFLVALLLAGIIVFLGYTFLRPDPLPDRIFRGKFRVINGDDWSMELADQNSLRFQHKARYYRETINLIIKRSDLRETYQGCEILALDGSDDSKDLAVLFDLSFDPYHGLVSTADLLAIFNEEILSQTSKFLPITIDPNSLVIKEVTGIIEEQAITSPSPLGILTDGLSTTIASSTPPPPRKCEPIRLTYCKSVDYNITTYPNLMGHMSIEEVQADVIAFRELVDAECFQNAYDFICRILQPPCEWRKPLEPVPGMMCREYCQTFLRSCGDRINERFKKFFDCENFPESTGVQTCRQKPKCSEELRNAAQSPRICDGIADCSDLSDEKSCSFCPSKSLYCGRGRACIPKTARCDGKLDCPDGSDEKDCLSIAPLTSDLDYHAPIIPYLPKFFSEGYAIFSEKGAIGKLCAEGLETESNLSIRQTVAESLCKSLGYESVNLVEIRNDTESITDYVRVLDPHAAEISFVRTTCQKKRVLYVSCNDLQCGVQSVLPAKQLSLPKMSAPGDWPWFVALYREDRHVCDGTLISADWVLTTDSCFQGQARATWLAIFGSVRLNADAPWKQRRRIIGMVKSPVEGSTAALIRLETPVSFSDFVRPICLPDEFNRKINRDFNQISENGIPKAQRLAGDGKRSVNYSNNVVSRETRNYFESPTNRNDLNDTTIDSMEQFEDDDESDIKRSLPVAEALTLLEGYPLPDKPPQTQYYSQLNISPQPLPLSYVTPKTTDHPWSNCNTLGWSRQRDHLQRVQLKIGDMAACENISIATVNSLCTEATYQKKDCTEEEFAGSPVQCLIPETNQWALIGVSSWRIACGPTGVERPRMYDKISSNSAWIRDTINAT